MKRIQPPWKLKVAAIEKLKEDIKGHEDSFAEGIHEYGYGQ